MQMKDNQQKHYQQIPRRKAQIITPPNHLKAKVGSGGLSESVLIKAQTLLENHATDFRPLGEIYLDALIKGIAAARTNPADQNKENIISGMLIPAMQLKANGGMFKFPLVTRIADHLVQFLEVVEIADADALEIVEAFQTTIRAMIMGRITGSGGRHGEEIIQELVDACNRYFQKHPQNRSDYEQDFTQKF